MSSIQERLNTMKQGAGAAASTPSKASAKETNSYADRLAKMKADGAKQTSGYTPTTTQAPTSKDQWVSTGGGRKSTQNAANQAPPQKQTSFLPMDNVGTSTRPNSRMLSDVQTGGTTLPSLGEWRVKNTVTGAAKTAGAGYVNVGGILAEGAGKLNTAIANANSGDSLRVDLEAVERYQNMLRDMKWADGKPMTAEDVKKVQGYMEMAQRRINAHQNYTKSVETSNKAVADKAYRKADELQASGEQDIAKAKEGLGAVGQFAVDLGVAGAQMAGDAAASAVIPGAGLAAMGVRSGGSAAQKARQAGATYDQQLAYGIGSGALSLATEKISNVATPFKKAFGGGVLDKAISGAVAKMNGNAVGKLALSMLSEGGEEFIEDVFQPVLQRATYDPNARFDLSEALYDAAVGAAMGGIGGAVDIVREHSNGPTAPQEVTGAQTDVREGNYAPMAQTSSEGQQNTASGVETAVTIESGPSAINERNKANNTLAYTLATNIDSIKTMDPVSRLSGMELNDRAVKPDQQIRTFFQKLGNKVLRKDFGEVQLNEYGIASMLNHKPLNRAKMLSLAAVPDVIASGQQISKVPNWKGRDYTSYIFAAPVNIGNDTVYVAAVVDQRPNNKFYLSEMVDSNGNYVRVNENPSGNSKSGVTDGGRTSAGDGFTARPEGVYEGNIPSASNQNDAKPVSPNVDSNIAQGAKNVKSDPLMDILFGKPGAENVTDTPGYDNLGSARQGFTTPGMEGTERTSRFAESMPYNQWQEAATGLSREDYAKIFRYESQTEGKSLHLAEELVYAVQDGKKTFLRDIDEGAFHELVRSLDDATAWNGPQMDAARMIQAELQGKSANMEIPDDEYTNFLKIMREHETSTGQGVQANAKWSRNDNNRGQSTELDAWNNLEKSKLSDAEKHDAFQKIVKWDTDIEAVKSGDTQAMKAIILDVANERGVLGGSTKKIADKALGSLTFDQLKQFAYASTSAMSTDATPANAGRKAKTIQILSMLSNPKTASKNIVGNASFYLLDALSMKGGALLDTAVSKLTGTRSVANEKAFSREALQSAMKAANMSIAEIALDVDMGSDQSRYGTGSQRTFKMNGEGVLNTGTGVDKFGERVLSTLERNQAYLLNATDEFFKGAARNVENNIQKLVDEGKIKTTDKNYAKNQAEQLARYRTFQDNTKLSAGIQAIHDVLNLVGFGDSGKKINGLTVHSAGLGDIAAPFTRVAGNLVSRGAEYSPYNVIKGTGEIVGAAAKAAGGNTDVSLQAKGVSDFARGMTGTMIAAGFMAIAKMGLLRKADDEDNENVAALNRSEGMTGTQFNWSAFRRLLSGGVTQWQNGDTLIDVSSIEPLNLLMDLGTEMAKSDENPVVSSFKGAPKSLVDASSSLPVVQFIGDVGTDVLKYGNDPIASISKEAASTLAASVVPNVLRATAQGLDDRPRTTQYGDSFWEKVFNEVKVRVPGTRETLPGSVDSFGNDRTYQGDTVKRLTDALLNPLGVNQYQQSEVSKELETLRKRTGDASFYPAKAIPSSVTYTDKNGAEHLAKMDYVQRQQFQKVRGSETYDMMEKMVNSSAYKNANDKEKIALLTKCREYGYQVAKGSVLGDGAVSAWVKNAQTSQQDIGVSAPEFLKLYMDYTNIMSGEAYEKTKKAVASGITVQQYAALKDGIDADGNGSVSQAEAQAYLNGQDFSTRQKADLWGIINSAWKKNPYK